MKSMKMKIQPKSKMTDKIDTRKSNFWKYKAKR